MVGRWISGGGDVLVVKGSAIVPYGSPPSITAGARSIEAILSFRRPMIPATRSAAQVLLRFAEYPSCTSAQYELLLGTEYKKGSLISLFLFVSVLLL